MFWAVLVLVQPGLFSDLVPVAGIPSGISAAGSLISKGRNTAALCHFYIF